MTQAEKQRAANALNTYTRDTSAMSDSIKTLCSELFSLTNALLNNGVLKTASNGEEDPTSAAFHYGVTDPDNDYEVHVEPWLLRDAASNPKAAWELENTLLHEVLHRPAAGPNTHSPPSQAIYNNGSLYKGTTYICTESPFDLLNCGNNNGCMAAYLL